MKNIVIILFSKGRINSLLCDQADAGQTRNSQICTVELIMY